MRLKFWSFILLLFVSPAMAAKPPQKPAALEKPKMLDIKGISRDLPFKLGPKDEKEQIHFMDVRSSYYKEVLSTIF